MAEGGNGYTLGEIGRAIPRIEHNIEQIRNELAEEVSRQRHRVNNVDATIAGYREILNTLREETQEIKESQKWAFRMIAATLVGLLAEAAFIVLLGGK